MPTLILVRHGQSQWNLENRFTGWVDVDLTALGETEARRGGQLIAAGMIALALVWPQGLGARSPDPFGHTTAAVLRAQQADKPTELKGAF